MKFVLLYLDPGSGSFLIQMIAAGALGILFYFKSGWRWIKSFFSKSTDSLEDEIKRDETSDENKL